jgi:hypothetical protein
MIDHPLPIRSIQSRRSISGDTTYAVLWTVIRERKHLPGEKHRRIHVQCDNLRKLTWGNIDRYVHDH